MKIRAKDPALWDPVSVASKSLVGSLKTNNSIRVKDSLGAIDLDRTCKM